MAHELGQQQKIRKIILNESKGYHLNGNEGHETALRAQVCDPPEKTEFYFEDLERVLKRNQSLVLARVKSLVHETRRSRF